MIKAPHGKCDICPLKDADFVPSEVNNSELVLLAEAPAYHEVQDGRPLVGVAGQELEKIINSIGAKRKDFNYVNSCSCRATKEDGNNRNPTDEEIKYCNERLIAELEVLNPRAIVTLGKIAYIALHGNVGASFRVGDVAGTEKIWRGKHKTYATYHPAAILHARREDIREKIETSITEVLKKALTNRHTDEQLKLVDLPVVINLDRPYTLVEMELYKLRCERWWNNETKCEKCIQKFFCRG